MGYFCFFIINKVLYTLESAYVKRFGKFDLGCTVKQEKNKQYSV